MSTIISKCFSIPIGYSISQSLALFKLKPNRMLKFLPIIPSSTSHKIYPLFFYSHIKAYYSHIVLFSLAV